MCTTEISNPSEWDGMIMMIMMICPWFDRGWLEFNVPFLQLYGSNIIVRVHSQSSHFFFGVIHEWMGLRWIRNKHKKISYFLDTSLLLLNYLEVYQPTTEYLRRHAENICFIMLCFELLFVTSAKMKSTGLDSISVSWL